MCKHWTSVEATKPISHHIKVVLSDDIYLPMYIPVKCQKVQLLFCKVWCLHLPSSGTRPFLKANMIFAFGLLFGGWQGKTAVLPMVTLTCTSAPLVNSPRAERQTTQLSFSKYFINSSTIHGDFFIQSYVIFFILPLIKRHFWNHNDRLINFHPKSVKLWRLTHQRKKHE